VSFKKNDAYREKKPLAVFIEELVSRTWVASAEIQTQAGRHASTHTHHPGYALALGNR
jgi:hypothetical protein